MKPNPILCLTGLALGVAIVSWLLWRASKIRHNTRGHRLGRLLAMHNGTRTKPHTWSRI